MSMSSNKRVKLENSLPYDVVEEILVRLPADSLLRFKSVNKSFYSLIQNPTFVSKQLHHQCKQSRSGFNHAVILFPTNAMRYTVFFLESPDHNLVNWDNIMCSIYNMPNTWQDHVLADVYSLRTDSWRPVPDPLRVLEDIVPPPDCYKMDGVCLGGFCYWSEVYSVTILSFDFSNEVFRAMYLPEQVYLNLSVRLMAWNESVAVITFDKQEKKRFRVWLLDFPDHAMISVKEEFTIDLNIEDLNDVKLVWNDDIILDMCSPLGMTYYNTTTQKTKIVPFEEISHVKRLPFEELSHLKSLRISGYVKSLVPLI